MAKILTEITTELEEFIEKQHIFFVGTAAAEGRVNVSPKGMDTLRIMGSNKVVWMNLTGSGNETAAHLLQNNRMTLMFCAFEGKPQILRLYGRATIFHQRDTEFQKLKKSFPAIPGARQIIALDVETVQTSCGFAVPFMEFREERTQLLSWAEKQGEDRLETYRTEKNSQSIDGFETKING